MPSSSPRRVAVSSSVRSMFMPYDLGCLAKARQIRLGNPRAAGDVGTRATRRARKCRAPMSEPSSGSSPTHTGEAIDMIHSIEPAEAILHRLVAEAEAALARRFDWVRQQDRPSR